MSRLTSNDRRIGPLTFGRSSWDPLRVVFSTGGGVDGHTLNHLTVYALGWVARLNLPTRMQPWRHWVSTAQYEWSRSPNGGYWEEFPREYGFSLDEGFLQVFLGAQTHDSVTTRSWSRHLPWTQWRFDRFSLFDADGKLFWTQAERDRMAGPSRWDKQHKAEEQAPKVVFLVTDYDHTGVIATTFITQREWLFGEGWFKWLSVFRPRKVVRSLEIRFSAEVGPEKGSWKGGLMGTSIRMLPGELHEAAFRRYCEQEHSDKSGCYRIMFAGAA